MRNVINLHGDPHQQTQALLPWYINGTLDTAESAMVEAHLAECADCRTELAVERGLSRQVGGLAMDVEQGWTAMQQRLGAAAPSAPALPAALVIPFWRRPAAIGWAITGQLAAAALALVVVAAVRQPPAQPVYQALGAPGIEQPGNLVVLFRPEIAERDMRKLLDDSQARVVQGPLASGAWVLRVEDARRAAVVATLRASPRILLAEPVDQAPRP